MKSYAHQTAQKLMQHGVVSLPNRSLIRVSYRFSMEVSILGFCVEPRPDSLEKVHLPGCVD